MVRVAVLTKSFKIGIKIIQTKVLIVSLLMLHFSACYAQDTINKLSGIWKVKHIKSLIPGAFYMTLEEYEDYEREKSVCLSAHFLFTNDSIKATSWACSFFDCELQETNVYKVKIVDHNDDDTSPFLDDKMVSKKKSKTIYWIMNMLALLSM